MTSSKQGIRFELTGWFILVGLILIALMSVQLLRVVAEKSPTIDEKTKIMLGYFPLATGEWRFQVENPPLTTVIQALPLMLIPDRPDPTTFAQWDDPAWQDQWPSAFFSAVADAFPNTYDDLISRARLMSVLLTVVITGMVAWIIQRWMGWLPALITLAWLVFSPNWLAHGSLANNDLLTAGLYFITSILFWRALIRPGWQSALLAGIALGAALGTKTSLLLLLPTMGVLSFIYLINIEDGRSRIKVDRKLVTTRFRMVVITAATTGVAGFLVLWLIYGLDFGSWRAGWPDLPLPTYVRKVLLPTIRHASHGHPSYLMGRRSMEGWWYYFPVIFLVKTPLPTIIGAAAGGIDLIRRKRWQTFLLLSIPATLWMAAAMLTRINIGYRHILPILPFLITLIGAMFWDVKATRARVYFVGVLLIWLIIGTVRLTPSYLAFYNEVAGGAAQGMMWSTDSNYDWGQDLEPLKVYMDEEGIDFIYLSYFGIPELPDQYGINYAPFPNYFNPNDENYTPYRPPAGIYAISATHLTGKTLYPVFGEDAVDWFNHQAPCGIAGTSIYIYCVEPDNNPPQWAIICDGLNGEISEVEVRRKTGLPELDVMWADCAQTLPLKDLPGYVFAPPETEEVDLSRDWISTQGEVQFIQRTFAGDPVFILYRIDD